MKRFLMLVGVAAVAAAMYVAAAPGSQQATGPTAKQFKALKKQVATLSKTVKTLKTDDAKVKTLATAEAAVLTACDQVAVPIDQFGNPQPAAGTTAEGYVYGKGTPPPSSTTEFYTTGIDVTDPTQDTGALWITGGDGTCNQLLNTTSGLRHAAAKAGVKVARSSSRPTFVAHQR